MAKRVAQLAIVFMLSLSISVGQRTSHVDAQDVATPAAVVPPQSLQPASWGEVPGQTANINGVDIYYEIYGAGDPVFLLHGALGNGTNFANQIPVLATKFKLIVMDSRGQGRSTFDDKPITYELMASDVLGLMDHLGIAKASVVGWSDGAIIALDIAIHHPERLDKVVAYGANFDVSGVRPDAEANPLVNAYLTQAALDYQKLSPQPARWDELLANLFNLFTTEPNYTEEQLKAITTPFLILDGAKEEVIDLNQTKLMALLIPDAQLVLMPDTGHFAPLDQPDEFNRIVLDYLKA